MDKQGKIKRTSKIKWSLITSLKNLEISKTGKRAKGITLKRQIGSFKYEYEVTERAMKQLKEKYDFEYSEAGRY